jgi:hypothetical protein
MHGTGKVKRFQIMVNALSGSRNFLAIYSKLLEVSIGIHMRGPAL